MKRKLVFVLIPIAVVLVAVSSFIYYKKVIAAPKSTATASVQTATVRKGSLTISASGTGYVTPSQEQKLAFEYSGTLSELSAKIGDQVKAGDVLASEVSSESTSTLQAQESAAEVAVLNAQKALDTVKNSANDLAVAQAEVNLATAQKKLDDLLHPTDLAISNAQSAVVTAQSNLTTAQNAYDSLYTDKGDAVSIATAKANLILAQQNVDNWQRNYDNIYADPATDYRKASALSNLTAAQKALEHAQSVLNWYVDPPNAAEVNLRTTDLAVAKAQLADAQATLASLQNPTQSDIDYAKAQVVDLQKTLDDLKAGPDATEVKLAEANLASAQAQLVIQQDAMAKHTLVAPFDGTILSVDAQVGDSVTPGASVITIADLATPQLVIYVDESDLNSVGVGYEVDVTFDALTNQTFTGHIISVDPSLTSMQNVSAVKATAQLDAFAKPQTMPVGLTASVEIVKSKADSVLLVPVEALKKLDTGKYGVFVMTNGTPTLHIVEVGLMDLTYAEIKSGVNEGDVVTTGIVETGK